MRSMHANKFNYDICAREYVYACIFASDKKMLMYLRFAKKKIYLLIYLFIKKHNVG